MHLALGQLALGDLRFQGGIRVRQLVARDGGAAQLFRHAVEGARQVADFIFGVHAQRKIELACADDQGPLAQLFQRSRDAGHGEVNQAGHQGDDHAAKQHHGDIGPLLRIEHALPAQFGQPHRIRDHALHLAHDLAGQARLQFAQHLAPQRVLPQLAVIRHKQLEQSAHAGQVGLQFAQQRALLAGAEGGRSQQARGQRFAAQLPLGARARAMVQRIFDRQVAQRRDGLQDIGRRLVLRQFALHRHGGGEQHGDDDGHEHHAKQFCQLEARYDFHGGFLNE